MEGLAGFLSFFQINRAGYLLEKDDVFARKVCEKDILSLGSQDE